MRGVGIARQNIQHFFAVLHAAAMNLMAKNGLRALVVQAVIKEKHRIAPRLLDCPSGKSFRDVDDVFLRVSAIYAECVKLHQFAAVVLVQAALLFLLPFRVRVIRICICRRGLPLRKTWLAERATAKTSTRSLLAHFT